MADQKPTVFREIDEYWSDQRNNELYVLGKGVERGSPEYWSLIEKARYRYNYYFPKMLDWVAGQPGRDLLEVGCGMAVDLARFAPAGFRLHGVDLATEHLRLARSYLAQKGLSAQLLHGNAEALPFHDESFDAAFSFGVLHHTREPQRGIDEIHRVLKPGGRAAVMLYHRHSLNNLVHVLLRIPFDNAKDRRPFAKDANFVYRYSRGEVRQMFRAFRRLEVGVEYVYGGGWEPVTSWTPAPLYRWLSRTVGWHLVMYAEK